MQRKYLFLFAAVLVLEQVCFADGGPRLSHFIWGTAPLGERDEGDFSEGWFADTDAVALRTQDMKIVLDKKGKVIVHSNYRFEVLKSEQRIEVAFVTILLENPILEGEPIKIGQGLDTFEVTIRGRKLRSDSYSKEVCALGNNPFLAVSFPLEFGPVGDCPVTIEYSYKLPKGFEVFHDPMVNPSPSSGIYYRFKPARFWAGNIDRIDIELVLDGIDMERLTVLLPSDFTFTENGCKWCWVDIPDKDLEHRDLRIGFQRPDKLGWGFVEVITPSGLDVYNKPSTDSGVLKTLNKGERVYLLIDDEVSRLNWPQPETITYKEYTFWYKCRFKNNETGYVKAVDRGQYNFDYLGYQLYLDGTDGYY